MIDLLNRKAERTLQIIGTKGTLEWNWLEKTIKVSHKEKERTEIISFEEDKKIGQYNTGEEAYEAEMLAFLKAIEDKRVFPYTFHEDEEILEYLNDFKEL